MTDEEEYNYGNGSERAMHKDGYGCGDLKGKGCSYAADRVGKPIEKRRGNGEGFGYTEAYGYGCGYGIGEEDGSGEG